MLEDALQDPAITGEQIYDIVTDLLDAVTYLHQRGVYHCDIKLDNIRMRNIEGGPSDVVLLDSGRRSGL